MRVHVLEVWDWGSEFGVRRSGVRGSGFSWFMMQVVGCRVSDVGFRVKGVGCRV